MQARICDKCGEIILRTDHVWIGEFASIDIEKKTTETFGYDNYCLCKTCTKLFLDWLSPVSMDTNRYTFNIQAKPRA